MESSGDIIGVFVGVDGTSYEYIAHIIAPYQPNYTPIMGDFMLIDNDEEYIVSRIMNYTPQGEMVTFMGLKWLSEMALNPEDIGQDIKLRKISYQVRIKLLGRLDKKTKDFKPGIYALPHITSRVIQPNTDIIEMICNKALVQMEDGEKIGDYSIHDSIGIHFDLKQLKGKRTFIFARAGYGKSNLMKIIASYWKQDYGSLIIFDPEGEYGKTDKINRPGILDVIPAILVTNRSGVKEELQHNVYDKLKFDLRKFSPGFIIPILVSEEKHGMIFYQKLLGLRDDNWITLIEYLQEVGWSAEHDKVAEIMELGNDLTSIQSVLNNIVYPIQKIHDPKSHLLSIIEQGVKRGIPIILDISLLGSQIALQLSSTIISHFFGENQKRFIGGSEDLYEITFVVEEAQSVIGGSSNVGKFVELAKEGRKYQLGGIFITQQPGSIKKEILSQGDNFFVFHLLSKTDLKTLQDSNSHYSRDILTQILNEPIKGKSYMWSSNQPFVLPVQIINFEDIAKPHNAIEIQKNNDILNQILRDLTELDEIERNILLKFKLLIQSVGLNINDKQTILQDQTKAKLTTNLFKKLDIEEKQFLKQKDALQKNKATHIPFAITYSYLLDLLTYIRIYQIDKELSPQEKTDEPLKGICIVCKNRMPLDNSLKENLVVCETCIKEGLGTKGEYCHFCGKEKEFIGKASPLCKSCWFAFKATREVGS